MQNEISDNTAPRIIPDEHGAYTERTTELNGTISIRPLTVSRHYDPSEADQSIKAAVHCLLQEIDNPEREGLTRTPERVASFYMSFLSPEPIKFTTFRNEGMDELIMQDNIPFYSLCEHHLLPFYGTATVAYIPVERIVGLSKLARAVEFFSRRLQNQERIGKQVAEFISRNLQTPHVAVILRARHLCMEMRGVKKHDTWTTTSTLYGAFREHEVRAELLQLRGGSR